METNETMTTKQEVKQEPGLLECTQMFTDTMDNKFFNGSNKTRSLIIMATDGDEMHICLFGNGERVINMIANALDSSDKFHELVMAAFVILHGSEIMNKFNKGYNHE